MCIFITGIFHRAVQRLVIIYCPHSGSQSKFQINLTTCVLAYERKPEYLEEMHTNSGTYKFQMLRLVGFEPRNQPQCCKATVLITEPPCVQSRAEEWWLFWCDGGTKAGMLAVNILIEIIRQIGAT